jgi:integrase/recombinase XerD
MDQEIKDFENYLLAQQKSLRTVHEYAWQVRRLAAWGARQSPPLTTVPQFKARDLNRYLAERRLLDEVGRSSIASATTAFKLFFGWLVGKRKSPAAGLKYPAAEMNEQRTLTMEQAARVLEIPDTSSVIGRRDLAILCLALDTGLRASEICRLTLANVHVAENYLVVKGKRSKLLYKAFCNYTAMQLANWLAVRVAASGVEQLFVSVHRGRGRVGPPGKGLTREALRGVCARVAGPAGIEQLSPHDFRRTCTCIAVALGCPDRIAELQLGWAEGPKDMLTRYSLRLKARQFLHWSPVAYLTGTAAPAAGGEMAAPGGIEQLFV